jgi:hypothetical protein
MVIAANPANAAGNEMGIARDFFRYMKIRSM